MFGSYNNLRHDRRRIYRIGIFARLTGSGRNRCLLYENCTAIATAGFNGDRSAFVKAKFQALCRHRLFRYHLLNALTHLRRHKMEVQFAEHFFFSLAALQQFPVACFHLRTKQPVFIQPQTAFDGAFATAGKA